MRITVPANVLLLGEYAVLEEGGIGVALAAEPRLAATITEAHRLELSGRWGGGRTLWTGTGEPDLFSRAVEAVVEFLGVSSAEIRSLPLHVEVDSSPFYDPAGGKRGFGSSAATAVAVCYCLLDRAGAGTTVRGVEPADPGPTVAPSDRAYAGAFEAVRSRMARHGNPPVPQSALLEATLACALRAHRAFQGGRGSGYDVAASVYGGVGRFVGGASPRYVKATLPWLPPLALFRGAAPVRTRDAVARYEAWKSGQPREAARFLERSNECVEGFLSAGSWSEAARWVEAARDLSIELGSATGAPAAMRRPPGFEGIVKAVGAGDELGVAFGALAVDQAHSGGLRSVEPVTITPRGVEPEPRGSGSGDDVRG